MDGGLQENSGVNCDNRDEIIVVAPTGRQKHNCDCLIQYKLFSASQNYNKMLRQQLPAQGYGWARHF